MNEKLEKGFRETTRGAGCSPSERDELHALDGVLYRGRKRLGFLHPHNPTALTRVHAEGLNIADGRFVQLTGTVFAFYDPGEEEIVYYELRE